MKGRIVHPDIGRACESCVRTCIFKRVELNLQLFEYTCTGTFPCVDEDPNVLIYKPCIPGSPVHRPDCRCRNK